MEHKSLVVSSNHNIEPNINKDLFIHLMNILYKENIKHYNSLTKGINYIYNMFEKIYDYIQNEVDITVNKGIIHNFNSNHIMYIQEIIIDIKDYLFDMIMEIECDNPSNETKYYINMIYHYINKINFEYSTCQGYHDWEVKVNDMITFNNILKNKKMKEEKMKKDSIKNSNFKRYKKQKKCIKNNINDDWSLTPADFVEMEFSLWDVLLFCQ